MIEALLGREGGDRGEEVLAQRAADASVRQLDHLLLHLKHIRAPHELGVNVDRRHVVDDDGDAVAGAIAQQMVQEGRLASTEEP